MIYEELHPETKNGASGNGRGKVRQIGEATSVDRFTKATAALTGESERSVQRVAKIGSVLKDDLKKTAGTSLDTPGELDALAKLPAPKRTALIKRASNGERVSARGKQALKAPSPKPATEPAASASPSPAATALATELVALLRAGLQPDQLSRAVEIIGAECRESFVTAFLEAATGPEPADGVPAFLSAARPSLASAPVAGHA